MKLAAFAFVVGALLALLGLLINTSGGGSNDLYLNVGVGLVLFSIARAAWVRFSPTPDRWS